jgi:hypothetical protein
LDLKGDSHKIRSITLSSLLLSAFLLINLSTSTMSLSVLSSPTELTLPTEWDHDTEMLNDEELSATSNEEASKVLEQWQADQEDQDLELMEVDEQIGSNLLGDDIFGEPCVSPTGPLEELVLMTIDDDDDDDRFFAPLLDSDEPAPNSKATSSLPFEERYQATLKKLEESMMRSQETRKSLSMKTTKTETYERVKSVSGVLTSIETSSRQLNTYLKTIQRL